jgi:hypothetical protein
MSKQITTLTPKNMNSEKIGITAPKVNPKDKTIRAFITNTETRESVIVESPYLINSFGVSAYEGSNITEEQKSYTVTIKEHGSQSENPDDVSTFFTFFRDLDKIAIKYIFDNSLVIFKKKYNENQIDIIADTLYNKCVKQSIGRDGTVYPDTIKLKVTRGTNSLPDLLLFKGNNPTPVELNSWEDLIEAVPKGYPIKVICQVRFTIYPGGKGAGISLKLLQMKVPEVMKAVLPKTYAFSDKPSTSSNEDTEAQDSDNSEVNVEEEED